MTEGRMPAKVEGEWPVHFRTSAPGAAERDWGPEWLCITAAGPYAKNLRALKAETDFEAPRNIADALGVHEFLVREVAARSPWLTVECQGAGKLYDVEEMDDAIDESGLPRDLVPFGIFLEMCHTSADGWATLAAAGGLPREWLCDGRRMFSPVDAPAVISAICSLAAERAAERKAQADRVRAELSASRPRVKREKREYRLPAAPTAHALAKAKGLLTRKEAVDWMGMGDRTFRSDMAQGLVRVAERVGPQQCAYFSIPDLEEYRRIREECTLVEAAHLLHVGIEKVRRLVVSGELPARRFNSHRVAVSRAAVEAMAARAAEAEGVGA